MARPTKYEPERVAIICESIAKGESNEVAAAKAGICLDSFYGWLKNKPDFSDAIKRARREFEQWELEGILKDARKSLKQLICGEEYEETKIEYEQDPEHPGKLRVRRKITTNKKILPNATAVIFALVNRDPEHWQNRVTQELNAKVKADEVDANISLARVPDDLLAQVLDALDNND